MSVQIDIADEILIARLIGDIDHHSAKEMRETIDEAVTRAQVRELDLDFKDVTFMEDVYKRQPDGDRPVPVCRTDGG